MTDLDHRRAVGVLVVCLVGVALVAPALAAGVLSGGFTGQGGDSEATGDRVTPGAAGGNAAADRVALLPRTDNTVTRIELRADGDAVWTVKVRTRVTDENEADYRAFQRRVRANRSRYLGTFRERMTRVIASAANATGRPMTGENFRLSTSIQPVPRRWGVVTYEFTWTNFARSEGDRLVVGDVFQGGFFLAANDTMEVVAPANYRITGVDPVPDERSAEAVTWEGEENFGDGRPRVEVAPATDGTTTGGNGTTTPPAGTTATGTTPAGTTVTATTANGTTPAGATGGGSDAVLWILAAVVLMGAGVGGAYFYTSDTGPAVATDAGTTTGPDAGPDGADAAAADPDPTPEILTDEDRVLNLLEERGGQVKQATIAEEFDWSSSKTSRTLSDMADAGDVEKIRIGRENVIRLPEDDPADDAGGDGDTGDGDEDDDRPSWSDL